MFLHLAQPLLKLTGEPKALGPIVARAQGLISPAERTPPSGARPAATQTGDMHDKLHLLCGASEIGPA
jgi:hypothetical protein